MSQSPRVLLLALTTRCNAQCMMCSIWQQPEVDMQVELLSAALADGVLAQGLQYVGLTGGEPTLSPAFERCVREIIRRSPALREVSLTTNGLDQEAALSAVDQVLAQIRGRHIRLAVNVSLDGIGPVHDRVRGVEGAFARADRTLHVLRQRLLNVPGALVSINAVLCSLSAYGADQLRQYAASAGVPVRYALVMDTDAYTNSVAAGRDFRLEEPHRQAVCQFVRRLQLANRLCAGDQFTAEYLDHLLRMLHGQERALPCPFAAGLGCLLDQSGRVYVCGVSEGMFLGSIGPERSFGSVWHSSDHRGCVAAAIRDTCRHCPSNCFLHVCEQMNG